MLFIGIIADKKNEAEIENMLQDKFKEKNINVEVISINDKNIENIKNVKFNTIIINGINNVFKYEDLLNKIIEKAQYLVINSDIEEILKCIVNIETTVISYGFNSKATITASSVSDEEMLICVQREFENIDNRKIDLQEINFNNKHKNEYISLGIATICLLYGINF